MINSLYKPIATVFIFTLIMVVFIQIVESGIYLAKYERWWVYIRHIDGDVSGHVVRSKSTYEDHSPKGSHQHTTDNINHNEGTFNCPAADPDKCTYCGPG